MIQHQPYVYRTVKVKFQIFKMVCTLNALTGVNFSSLSEMPQKSMRQSCVWGRSFGAKSCPPAGRDPFSTRTHLNPTPDAPSTEFTTAPRPCGWLSLQSGSQRRAMAQHHTDISSMCKGVSVKNHTLWSQS